MSDSKLSKPTRVRINPSRRTCEEIIRRILNTENEQNGKNIHFKTAMDFMAYFESLYPSGAALTKQVQRAIKSMNLAKDEDGYFLIGKTKEDLSLEQEISSMLEKTDGVLVEASGLQTTLLRVDPAGRSYLASLMLESKKLRENFFTIVETVDGLLILTEDAEALKEALSKLYPGIQSE